jgi:hypothetical protein
MVSIDAAQVLCWPCAPQEVCAVSSNVFLLAAIAAVAGVGPSQAHDASQLWPAEPLEIDMFYQYSATNDDAEVTIDVESSIAIDRLTVLAPDGHTVMLVRAGDHLGLRHIEVESDEPSVEKVQRAYPKGRYLFTHDVVAAPDFFNFSPCNEEVDPNTPVTIAWNTVVGADGGYEIIIEQDDTGANLRITRGAGSTSFVIPDGFLVPGLKYEIEMKSVAAGGNKTSASCGFSTR